MKTCILWQKAFTVKAVVHNENMHTMTKDFPGYGRSFMMKICVLGQKEFTVKAIVHDENTHTMTKDIPR